MSLAERKLNHAIRERILALDPSDIRVEYFRPDEGMMIYHVGRGVIMDLAEEADALYRVGRNCIINKERLFKTLLAIVIVIAVIIISAVAIVSVRMSGQVKAFDKSGIDLSHVADGVYNGHSETDLVKVDVRVTVADGRIEDIEILKHECGKGYPADVIVSDMIKDNTVEVDAVSGATMSSEVIKDAVRDALRSGL